MNALMFIIYASLMSTRQHYILLCASYVGVFLIFTVYWHVSLFLGKLLCAVTHPVERIQRSCSSGAYLNYSIIFMTCNLSYGLILLLLQPSATKKHGRHIGTCLKILDMTGLKLSALNNIKVYICSPLTSNLSFLLTVTLFLKRALNLQNLSMGIIFFWFGG